MRSEFPELTFTSTRITGDESEFKVTGDLTIRGVTREVTLDVTNEGRGKDPWGGDRIGFSAQDEDRPPRLRAHVESGDRGRRRRSSGNEVKISIEVQAVKQALAFATHASESNDAKAALGAAFVHRQHLARVELRGDAFGRGEQIRVAQQLAPPSSSWAVDRGGCPATPWARRTAARSSDRHPRG